MPSTDWTSIESSLFDVSAFNTVLNGVDGTLDIAKAALEAAKVIAQASTAAFVVNPIEAAITLVQEALANATAAMQLDASIHVLFIPGGKTTYDGYVNNIAAALSDSIDLNRPDFTQNDTVAGAVLLGTASSHAEVLRAAGRFAKTSRNPNRTVGPIRMLIDGSPAWYLRVPQDAIATPYRYNGASAVRVMWAPERKLGTTLRQLDPPLESSTIHDVVIVRSTEPLSTNVYDEDTFPDGTEIVYTQFAGYDKPNVYADTAVDQDTTYFYYVGYRYKDSFDVITGPHTLSNEAWVYTDVSPAAPLSYRLPYWITVQGALSAFYPDVVDINLYISDFITGYLDSAAGSASNASDLVTAFIDDELSRLDMYQSTLASMAAKLAAVAAPWPVGGLGSFTFTSDGSQQAIVEEISSKMYDTEDEDRPDLTDKYSFAVVFIVGSETATAALNAQAVLSLLVSGEPPAPDPGLAEAIASIGAAINSVNSAISSEFAADFTVSTTTTVTPPQPTLLELP